MRSQSDETRDNRARTQTTLETVGVSIANIDTQLRALREREEADAARQETLQSELEGHNAAEAEKRGALSGLRDEGKALAEELAELGKQIAALADEHQRLSGLKTGVEARLESLRARRVSSSPSAGLRGMGRIKTWSTSNQVSHSRVNSSNSLAATSEADALVRPEHGEPAAEVHHIAPQQLHLARAHGRRRILGEHDGVEGEHLPQVAG